MTRQEGTIPKVVQPITQPAAKRPYEKPAFRFERVFVTTALSCGKISVTQGQCGHNTKAS
jgi:hypothetical protein